MTRPTTGTRSLKLLNRSVMTSMPYHREPKLQLSGKPIVPFAGESLRSLVARSCFENDIPNSFGLLKPLGLLVRNRVRVSEGDDVRSDELAHAMKMPESEVASRRYEALGLGYVDFFGVQVNRMRINNGTRRFAPAALATNPHHRALWELRDLPFCLESWDMLRDTCPCSFEGTPTVQRWTRTQSDVSECDSCGEQLSQLAKQLVPDEYRSDLSLLTELLSPTLNKHRKLSKFLPAAIASTDRGRIYDCLRLLCDIAKGGRIDGLEDEFADKILRWHAACRALRNWPNAVPGTWIDDDVGHSPYAYRLELYHDLASEPSTTMIEFKKRTGSLRPLIKRKLATNSAKAKAPKLAAEKVQKAEQRRKARQERERRKAEAKRFVGIRPAYEAAKLDPATLLQARDEGLLTKHQRRHGPRLVPAFDINEVAVFGAAWNARIPVSKVSFDFRISHHGIEQLVALNAIQATGLRFEDENPKFMRQDITSFLKQLISKKTNSPGPWSTLKEAMHQIDDRPKPWGPVMAEIVAGKLTYRLPDGFVSDLSTVEILTSDIPAITQLHFDRSKHTAVNFKLSMIQRDVCELFNLSETRSKDVGFLPSSGEAPKRYECSLAEGARSELISHNELARRFGFTRQRIRSRLKEVGVAPVAEKFYDREKALRLFGKTIPD